MRKTWPVRISFLSLALFGVLFLIFVRAGSNGSRDGLNSSVTIHLPAPRPYDDKTIPSPGFSRPIL
jgi:hypothetical protein